MTKAAGFCEARITGRSCSAFSTCCGGRPGNSVRISELTPGSSISSCAARRMTSGLREGGGAQVERVVDGRERREQLAQGGGRCGRPFGQLQPRLLGKVEGKPAHGARVGHDGGAAGRRKGPRGEQQRHVGERVEPVHHRHAGMGEDGAGDGEIAGDGAGVGLRGASRRLRAPRLHQDDALAERARAGGEAQELLRLAHLLDEQRRHARRRILQDRLEEILRAEHRLVAGADEERHPEPRGNERIADGVGDGPALGDDGDAGRGSGSAGLPASAGTRRR